MSRLTPVCWRDLVKRLQELGFEGPYAGGKHPQMRRGDVTVIIPNPHEGDISVGL
ncbi:type II toxin-antitoxin system HicA family toxin [Desmonostoc muscorum CCALA 125]|nr:type II toxin-antitoxin system HicA family toxin [Desmonostoc muscorum CCALA 125]